MNTQTIALSILCSAGVFALRSTSLAEACAQFNANLADVCTQLDVNGVTSSLSQGAEPNSANYVGAVLKAVLEKNTPPPSQQAPSLEEFTPNKDPAAAIILDALFRAGANPVATAACKQENVQLLTELEKAWAQERSGSIRHPLYIALQKLLHALLVYEVSKPANKSKAMDAPILGDSKLVTRYLKSITTLRKNLSNKKIFDPLNTPLAQGAKGVPGQTPVQLAARNGHYRCLKAMLEVKDGPAFSKPFLVDCQTAYIASLTASAQGTLSTMWKSCKDLLSNFMGTYCEPIECNHATVINTAQNNVARTVWNNPKEASTDIDQTIKTAVREAKKIYIEKQPRFWAP
jgi:hypothetical protein